MTFASIILIFIGIAAGILALVLLISLMVSAGRGIGFIIGHVFEYAFGTIGDAARVVGALVAAVESMDNVDHMETVLAQSLKTATAIQHQPMG